MKSFLKRHGVALLVALAAGPAAAQFMLLGDHRVFVQYAGPGLPNTVEFAPSFKEVTVGNSYALGDLSSGILKASSFWPGTVSIAISQVANAGAQFRFQNMGLGDISFAAGALGMDVKATFTQILGPGAVGVWDQTLNAVIQGSGPSFASSASVAYQYTGRGGPTDFFAVTTKDSPGSSSVIHTGTTSALDATLSFAAFTLKPGEIASFTTQLTTSAWGSQLGWGAFTDATHTAQLSLRLPAGVTLDSPLPLTWVTSVPEPSTGVILLAGLAGLAMRQRWRSGKA